MAIETNKITYGGDMMVFVAAKPIAFSTSAKLDITLGTRDIGSKDSGIWDEKAAAKISWSASTDALMTDGNLLGNTTTYGALYTLMVARTAITMVFGTATGTPPAWTVSAAAGKTKFTGQAYITSISMNADDGSNGSFSVSLEGTGELGLS